MSEGLEGLIAAPYTPMNEDGTVAPDRVPEAVDFLTRNGVKGGFVCGTTGESLSLSVEERIAMTEAWCKAAGDKFKAVIHVGHNSLPDARKLAAHAQEHGAWGIGAMPPVFFKPESLDHLVNFLADIAAAAPELPFYYYHIPSLTQVNILIVELLEKAKDKIPNLAGAKYTHEDLMDFRLCLAMDEGRFNMVFGRDEILMTGLAMGAKGAIGTTYNFAAPLFLQIIEAMEKKDLTLAAALQQKAMQMVRAMRLAPAGFLGCSKALMKTLGLDCGPVRKPHRPPTPEEMASFEKSLDEIGFFEYASK